MKTRLTLIFILTISINLFSQDYLNITLPDSVRALDLLKRMTLDEKIGQMIQAEKELVYYTDSLVKWYKLGSVLSGGGSGPAQNTSLAWADMYDRFQTEALNTRLKIPIIYGIDAVHGNNNVYGSVIFPHNIGLGCTRDTSLVRRCAEITAYEVAATGIDWTFCPCIAVVRDIRWGRTYEGFGETPELSVEMAGAAVKGYQVNSTPIMACAKHYIADGGTQGGDDQGNAAYTEADLRRLFLPPYKEAVDSGVASVMVSFSSWNQTKMHGNKYLITNVLKGELGFKGFVVSDWAGIDQINNDYKTALKLAINAGIDMVMEPNDIAKVYNGLKSLVSQGLVDTNRINDAVKRILTQKFRFGIFENPFTDRNLLADVGSTAHREVAREAVRKSLVLLKNNGVLPLSKTAGKIFVGGSLADNLGAQCGGWTISWQGGFGDITQGTTILEAVNQTCTGTTVIHSDNSADAVGCEYAIIVCGEYPYAEYMGDNNELSLSPIDSALISNIKDLGVHVVVVLISGRPLIINDILPDADAFFAAWLPGTEGLGITDVLFGDYMPSGKLSHSWPTSVQQIPINYGDNNYNPLFPYGYGLMNWSATDNPISNNITVYPNPVNKTLNILLPDAKPGQVTYRIFDNQGRLVYWNTDILTISGEKFSIDVSSLNYGIYFLEIESMHNVFHQKIIKK